jgi:hypothetical protein
MNTLLLEINQQTSLSRVDARALPDTHSKNLSAKAEKEG